MDAGMDLVKVRRKLDWNDSITIFHGRVLKTAKLYVTK